MTSPLALLLCALPLAAGSLDTLRAHLQQPAATEPLKASVDIQTWTRRGDENKPVITQGRATAWVEHGPQGLRLFWSRELLAQARKEARLQSEDPEKTTPTRDAMAALDVLSLETYFDPAARILQDLDQATLQEERPDTLDGRPCRLLVLKLAPKVNQRARKYVKELEGGAKVWLDPEGQPLAADLRLKVRGKALLVITFATEEHDEYRFQRLNGRLVTVRHLHENTSSGAGESGQSRRTTVLAFN